MGKNDLSFNEKSFFYSADSEHYQDAVLLYLFNNFPQNSEGSSEIEQFSKFFVKSLLGDISVIGIDVENQRYDSDISLIIHTSDHNNHLVVIEDKTGSAVHSSKKNKTGDYYNTQLEKYYDLFLQEEKYREFFKEGRVHLFYYKNDYVDEFERKIIKDAGEGCKKILKAPFADAIKKLESEIEGKKRKDAINKRKDEINKYHDLNNVFASCYSKYGDSVVEWKILNIDWIYKTFETFFEQSIPENYILREYYASIAFWKERFETIKTCQVEKNNKLIWNDKSKMWHRLFCDIIENQVKDSIDTSKQNRYVVGKYNGLYWEMAFASKDKRTAMLIDTRSLNQNSITIMINLRNELYDHDDIPDSWKKNKGQRALDKKIIKEEYNHRMVEGILPKTSNYENRICSYTFPLKNDEFLGYDSIIKYWKAVETVFNEIDGKLS